MTIHRYIVLFPLLGLLSGALLAQEALPRLTLEQQTSLRCATAFAIVADGQARGDDKALAHPPLAERGREFFVRSAARLMDDAGLTREQVGALMGAEALKLRDDKDIDAVMPACLLLLDASGL